MGFGPVRVSKNVKDYFSRTVRVSKNEDGFYSLLGLAKMRRIIFLVLTWCLMRVLHEHLRWSEPGGACPRSLLVTPPHTQCAYLWLTITITHPFAVQADASQRWGSRSRAAPGFLPALRRCQCHRGRPLFGHGQHLGGLLQFLGHDHGPWRLLVVVKDATRFVGCSCREGVDVELW